MAAHLYPALSGRCWRGPWSLALARSEVLLRRNKAVTVWEKLRRFVSPNTQHGGRRGEVRSGQVRSGHEEKR